ncbi:F-box protein SKIP23 isoform X2 [Spinacia oleracea]|uniref:F-box protein SKIP23 isoform X2 n=1 Tax=Spinacia oleracea TaxID=3562 RepID=A0ABM3RA88_SPIOL|nr:F-box protein SKIP23-like isoform X2 [Spinacia oleracea]
MSPSNYHRDCLGLIFPLFPLFSVCNCGIFGQNYHKIAVDSIRSDLNFLSSACAGHMDNCDWSALPVDILGEIVLKLESPQDIIYFSAVCSSWHYAYFYYKKKWNKSMPLLMLPENTTDNPNFFRNIFCPNNQRCYQLKLPQTFGARCWGSSCGWIVTFDVNQNLHMFNPLTTTRIPLPHLSTMPGHDFYDEFFDKDDMSFYELKGLFLEKVLVIQADDRGVGGDDYILITVPGQTSGIVNYAKPGDLVWTSVITKEINIKACVKDVVRWGSQIIFLYADGNSGYCDINALNHSNLEPATLMKYLPPPERFIPPYKVYLLVSFGDLLMVCRHKRCINYEIEDDPDDFSYQTIDFEVYKLNLGTKNWKRVNELDDVALFVGDNTSMSVRASNFSNCKSNCIYFTDDEWQFWDASEVKGGHDMGLFNMTKKKIETIYEGDDIRSVFCTAFWFMPMF